MLIRFSRCFLAGLFCLLTFFSCQEDEPLELTPGDPGEVGNGDDVDQTFDGNLDLSDPFNYGSQPVPAYITRDNTGNNPIDDATATLGRVLFYDVRLSENQTISCASCHRQELAFGDDAIASVGVAGTTARHSMRLVNARFGSEVRFFWDERAQSLEAQTTQPIRDHIEMGFSGEDGDPGFDDLVERMTDLDYYGELFSNAFGSAEVTEPRMQEALAQFIRSIQSFDSRFDEGRALVRNGGNDFPNFTAEENEGRELFGGRPQFDRTGNRIGGGLGCGLCHESPEFAIDPNSRNNGVTAAIGNGAPEFGITRSPSLRDLYQPDGTENAPFMHNGAFRSIDEVLDHYNNITATNPQLDRRLQPSGIGQRLNMSDAERRAVVAFLKTLSGSAVYTDERWANPFSGE